MPRRRASALAGTVALFAAGTAWALPPTGEGNLPAGWVDAMRLLAAAQALGE
jgi:hypothetical protein